MNNKSNKIGRNDPCPCGSGLKYKKCHLDSPNKPSVKISELDKAFNNSYSKKYCSVPDLLKGECEGGIIKAHSVTKSSLEKISQNDNVFGFNISSLSSAIKNGGKVRPKKIGKGVASIFTGFCSKHDNSLFTKIEDNNFSGSKEECFLHAYRALCMEYFTRKCSIDFSNLNIITELHSGKTPSEQMFLQEDNAQHKAGLNVGMKYLEKYKSDFDNMLISKDFDNFNSLVLKFKKIPTVMASGMTKPIYDFNGNLIQDLRYLETTPVDIYHNTFSSAGLGYVIFSWIGTNMICENFIQSLNQIKPCRITNAIIRFLFSSCENIYISPLWWDNLDKAKQQSLINRFQSNDSLYMGYQKNYYL